MIDLAAFFRSRSNIAALLLMVAAMLPQLFSHVANIGGIADGVQAVALALAGVGLRDAVNKPSGFPVPVVAPGVPQAPPVSPLDASAASLPPVVASEEKSPVSPEAPAWYASKTKLGAILAAVSKVAAVAFPPLAVPLGAASLAFTGLSVYGLRDAVAKTA